MKNKNTIPAVARAIEILRALGDKPEGALSRDLAEELGIAPTSCYRVLQTLAEYDWVQTSPGNRYELSLGLLAVTSQAGGWRRIMSFAQGPLDKLSAVTGLSAKVSIRQGEEQVAALRSESPRPVALTGRIGARYHVVEGSSGACLLLDASDAELEALSQSAPTLLYEARHPESLKRRVQEGREQGLCASYGESAQSIYAVSAPLRDALGRLIAAMTVIGLKEDFTPDRIAPIEDALRRAVAECSDKI